MTLLHRTPSIRCASVFAAAFLWAAGIACGQSVAANPSRSVSEDSSSQAGLNEVASLSLPAAPAPALSAGAGSAAGQYGNGRGYTSSGNGLWHRLAFEASGGFNAPAGDKAYITWGGQFTVGAGYKFTPHVAALIEYQFMDDKLPGRIISEAIDQPGAGGHDHIWSFTVDPVYDFFPAAKNDLYATGGGGFYRKVTSFTNVAIGTFCGGYGYYYYGGCGYAAYNEVVGHFSSNQGGWNIGGGYQYRLGGRYDTSRVSFFTEVRYVDVLSPAVLGKSANGLNPVTVAADTKVIPVSFGVRW